MYASANAALIVAQPTLHRAGIVTLLQEAWPAVGITLHADASGLLPILSQQLYDLVVLDCAVLAGPACHFLEQLRKVRSTLPVLLLTSNRLSADVRQYLETHRTSAWSWLPYHATPAAVAALFAAHLPAEAPERARPKPAPRLLPPTPFSRRELEVLRLVVQDHCNQEIANQLCLSVRTVESHRRALLQKAGAKTLVGLAVRAVQHGWVMV
ncbi:response regulator transcription factor [Hymenobacter taeanensis]|uniref:Response regulator transcription factor n=1 Tax=Hymenobacter taeanensis TaxID=2735321 RepID=A0A6M6BG63_9BACT|nr:MULTISPECIES: response regulator transcription factor [Hymenobacter]QJX46972.1 response regulator transcription factor [Hymenobacter taeanensis]UOQ80850.1 response regulator transcription factor [Hymenobacter sp. 5414T-23]